MLIGRTEIAALLPHGGDMCLLDCVQAWDAVRIVCQATSHRSANNPLRRDGRLGVLAGVEYAAQAMALHAALCASGDAYGAGRATRGYLASLRGVSFHQERLDLIGDALIVEADCQHREAGRAVYGFTIRAAGQCLLEGRAIVVIEPT
jgi:predicted hotdog family 3-hydroxylacyl-ACP dehydratase